MKKKRKPKPAIGRLGPEKFLAFKRRSGAHAHADKRVEERAIAERRAVSEHLAE